ncbi:MAG: hypothetical protein IKL82_02290 [Clostridia bacterium]|nr:hypothetical protein [Clostridia bacterium]
MKNKVIYPVSIIDIGSNSVRLMTDYQTHSEKFIITTRLAQDMQNGVLNKASMERTVNAIKEFVHKATLNGSKSLFAFATAAVRNSVNSKEFIDVVKEQTGVLISVVSGEVEAELAGLGALNENGAVVDIGGASTEIIIKQNGQTVYSVSYPVGAVNLRAKGLNATQTQEYLSGLIKGVKIAFKGDFVAIGGTSLTLTAMSLGLTEYDNKKTHGAFVSKEELEKLSLKLNSLSPKLITKNYPYAKSRADVIGGGSLILLAVLGAFNQNGFYASESDNLEGYLKYLTYEKP